MRYLLILMLFSCFISCTKEDELQNRADCATNDVIRAPEGYVLDSLASTPLEWAIETFQMIDRETGFALVDFNTADSTGLLKTTDGGANWIPIALDISHDPSDMVFSDEETAYFSVYDPEASVLYIYNDQMESLERIEYPELDGHLNEVQSDENGNLYAELVQEEHSLLLRSNDQAVSWDTLYSTSDFKPQYNFSFLIRDEYIYLAGDQATLIVTDKSGHPVAKHPTGLSDIADLEVVDEMQLIASNYKEAVASDDGGQSWMPLHDDGMRVIDFSSVEEGLVVFQDSSCIEYDIIYSYDAIASTTNGGMDWNVPEYTTGMLNLYKGAAKIEEGEYLLFFRNEVYRLSEE